MAGRSGSSGGRSGSSGGRSSSGGSSSFGRSSSGGWNSSGRSGSTGSRSSTSSNNNNSGMSDFEKLFILNNASRPKRRTTVYNYNTPNYSTSTNNPKNSFTSIIVSILMVVLVTIFVHTILNSDGNDSNIAKSTVERTPITQGKELEYYHDDLGWIKSSDTLEDGMKYFFKKTGVQPILYIKGDIDGNNHPNQATVDTWLQETYDATISDESHMILLIMDDGQGNWGSWVYVGSTAATVIDKEAQTIILNFMNKWYNSDPAKYSEDVLFANVFTESADRIMSVTPNYSLMIVIGLGLIIAAIIIINLYIKAQKARKETLEASAEVLNAPIKRPGQEEEK